MKRLLIKTTYDLTTFESAERGDFAETGWEDKVGQAFNSVKEAIEWLREKGIEEPSSSVFHPGIWYSGVPEIDCRSGNSYRLSFHLSGFSKSEQEEVYESIKGKK